MKTISHLILLFVLFSYSFTAFSRTLVISDIDDTIKKANSMGGVGGLYHFLRKKPYNETRDLFNEINQDELGQGHVTNFYYVSAAPSYTFDADEWIEKHNFPGGPTFLKTKENGGETYEYKYRTIKNIIQQQQAIDSDIKVLFFGDNSQHDAKVYFDLNNDMKLNAEIYIRDVSTEATFLSATLPIVRLPGVKYFFSEMELINDPRFYFMTSTLKKAITTHYLDESLIPPYTLGTLEDRIKEICKNRFTDISEDDKSKCKAEAKERSLKYWYDYHHKY